jgi:hypothetical protein
MASVYDSGLRDLTSGALSGGAPWTSNTYKMALVTSGYVFSNGHSAASAFSGFELSSLSFNAGFGGLGRLAINGKVLSYNTTSHHLELFGSAVSWGGLSAGSVGGAVMVRESSTDALSPLIAFYPIAGSITTNGGDFVLSAPASGYLVVSAG